MQEGTPDNWFASTYIVPGPIFEEPFRGNFTARLWAYARSRDLLCMEDLDETVTLNYCLVVDELARLSEWIPMPRPGQDQSEWADAYLLWCKSEIRDKCAGEEISEISQRALLQALAEHPPPRGLSLLAFTLRLLAGHRLHLTRSRIQSASG